MKRYVWLALGDSITEKNQRTEKNYHCLVKEALGNIEVINAGEGGTGFRHHHKTRPPFYKRIDRYKDYQIDFITILGCINDLMLDDGRVGKCGDAEDDSYMGCLDILVKKIRANFPNIPLAIISTVPQEGFRPGSGDDLEKFISEEEKYAKENNIPFLDIYHDSPLKPWEKENNKAFFYSCPEIPDGDGLHPNTEGHKIMADKITPFIKNIVDNLEK